MSARRVGGTIALAAIASSAAVLPARPAAAVTPPYAVTGRASITTEGTDRPQTLANRSLVDATGRFVAFSTAAALDPNDGNGGRDAYLRDRVAGTTKRVGLTDADEEIGGTSDACGMSSNGRFIAFAGKGAGLPAPAALQIYLRDRTLGTTTLVSTSSAEVPSTASSDYYACPVSDNGRYVAFVSGDPQLAPGDNNGTKADIFRRDLQAGTTIRVSVSTTNAKADGPAQQPAMSADGSVVAFTSGATNLVATDTNGIEDVFVRSISTGQTTRMSEQTNGTQTTLWSVEPSLSADGTKVAFLSSDPTLVANDLNGKEDIFVRNRTANTLTRASLTGAATPLPGASARPSLSDDGTKMSFTYDAPDGTPGDPNNVYDVYIRDLVGGVTKLISAKADGTVPAGADYSALSGDGTVATFNSYSNKVVRNDGNGSSDIFVRDLAQELDPFTSHAALVKQQFADFEGRPPTADELTEWTARLANGEKSPDEEINDLAHGATFAGKRAPMIRLYWAFFLRAPDKNGLDYWVGRLTAGKSLASVAKQFAASSEFQTKYGSKTNSQFVTLIYQNIFKRNPDPGGLAFWTARLDTKTKTRGDVMVNFSESSEGKRVLAPQTDTILLFLGMLRSMPSKQYLDLTLANLKGEWVPQTTAATLRGSGTYQNRITP